MTKKQRVVFLVVLAAVLAVAGLYWWWQNRVSPAWKAIPASAVLVVETDNPLQTLQAWQQTPAGQSLVLLPYFQNLLARLDQLRAYPETGRVLAKKKILFSLHATTRQDFDYVFFVPLTDAEQPGLEKILRDFRKNAGYRTDTRTFGGETITEITHVASRQQFSYILHDHVFIGSYTSLLVEEVIRTVNENAVTRTAQWADWREAGNNGGKQPVKLYANLAATPRLVQVLTGSASEAGILAHFGRFAALSASHQKNTGEKNSIFLKGQTSVADLAETGEYLRIFDGQSPQSIQCLSLIPNQTSVLYHWSFSNAAEFLRQHRAYDQAHNPRTSSPKALPGWVGGEMALALIETTSDLPDRLLIVQAKSRPQALQNLDRLAKALDNQQNTDSYSENYAGVPIRQMNEADFPASLFGAEINGFGECFYTGIGNHVVFGSSVRALKNLLDSRTTGEVWGQSGQKRKLFEKQKPALFTVHADVSRAWGMFLRNASPQWRQLMQQYSGELKDFEAVTCRITSQKEKQFGTELTLHHREKPVAARLQNRFFNNWRTNADTLLTMPPAVVRSHLDRSRETLLQDAGNRLYLVSEEGTIRWRRWLESPVKTPIFQIDYLKNNKLQYLFATKNALQLIDRNGSPVAPYPMKIGAATGLHTLSVIDYEGDLDYRFLISDLLGNLYMYDKAGTPLEGWNPLRMGYRLQCAPQHIRLGGKDYFAILQANGQLTLVNRRGQAQPGFPLNLKARTESPFLIENGTSMDETRLVVVTNDGEMLRINLRGEIAERRQFNRTAGGNRFRLCAEPGNRDWVVARLDNSKTGLLDKNGNLLFEADSNPAGEQYVQYYNFGSGLQLVAITQAADKQTRVYNLNGQLVGSEPFGNRLPIAAVYVDAYQKLLLHYASGRQAGVLSIKVK